MSDGQPAPASRETCNLLKCAEWEVGAWDQCSTECGPGQQKRRVDCKRGAEVLLDRECGVGFNILSVFYC
jgi:hypothetical protein